MNLRSLFLFAISICFFTLTANADDWPQWRGPRRDGISMETGLLKAWPKTGPKLLWQVKDAGDGYSTPAVRGDRMYVLSNKGNADEFLQARDVKDGKLLWSKRLGGVGANTPMAPYPGTRSTATIDGDLVYALGSDGDLVCFKADGAEVWRKSLSNDFGGKMGLWAYSESPLVDGDWLVCTPGGSDATLVALDKKKGNVIWKSAVPGADAAAYASIVIVEADGVKQYVQVLQNGIVGVDAKSGKFLWRYDKAASGSLANIPTPVTKDNFVYTSTGKGGAALLKLKAAGADEVYFKKALPNSIGGAVLLDGHLFGTTNRGLMCVELASGKEKWQDPCVGAGSVCYADGRLYVHGENGDMALVEAIAADYREVGRFTPVDSPMRGKSKAWAYPIIADGRLYVRDLSSIWCYDIKGGS